ncbi:unnamed protein product [Cuscuta epithymum]|uniref:Uncharacterized protein n=1 Tax=Cuscuta epithymum TaxID=186058 RepID=A0AAV0FVS7_9ASTE|nr:unnamed protein product [Cuscuta epithymum]
MNQETGFHLGSQVDTSADLLRKYKLKAESITASRERKGNAASKQVQKNLMFNKANAQVIKNKGGVSNVTQQGENVTAARQSKRSASEQKINKGFNVNRAKPQIINNTRGDSNPSEQGMSLNCGSIQKSVQKEIDQGSSHLGTIPIQKKKHDQNKQFLNTRVAAKKLGHIQVPCVKKPGKSTIRGQLNQFKSFTITTKNSAVTIILSDN